MQIIRILIENVKLVTKAHICPKKIGSGKAFVMKHWKLTKKGKQACKTFFNYLFNFHWLFFISKLLISGMPNKCFGN